VLEKFREYKPEVEKQTGKSIKRLRTDGGGEYEKWMGAHLKGSGIIHETTAPYSPDQNGVAERANRTIMERVKAIIAEAKLDKRLWMEIADTVVYLKNRSPTSAVTTTPYELWHGVKPNLSHLSVRSCSKGKAHEARYPFSQGDSDRLWRHESVQGMGFDKK
jgi:transposase InsO family protein